MKFNNKKKLYILLAAIGFGLIGLVAAYYGPVFDSEQGTHQRGIFNMLIYIKLVCFMCSILLTGFWALVVISKSKRV